MPVRHRHAVGTIGEREGAGVIVALDFCTIETVEIAVGNHRHPRVERVTAHRYLDFAIHRSITGDLFRERWCITHLPTGLRCADGFSRIEAACEAMIEIARLRNDWSCITEDDVSRDLTLKVKEIITKHDPRARLGDGRKGEAFAIKNLNGYAEQQSA